MRFDAAQPLLFLSDVLCKLCSAEPQHPPQLVDRQVLGKDLPDLFQGEAHVTQRHDPVQLAQLADAVKAVAAVGVNQRGVEEPELVVVAEHARRNLPKTSELPDVQHDNTIKDLHTV